MMKWHDNLEAVEKNKSVLTQLDSHHAAKVKENRDYVKILIDTIAFLGKQNIPFRGHEEDRSNLTQLSEVNRGNFLEILCIVSPVFAQFFSKREVRNYYKEQKTRAMDVLQDTERNNFTVG